MDNTTTNWLQEELANQPKTKDYEELPSLKLTPNVSTEITVDISKPFQSWTGEQKGKPLTKKIIPVTVNGTKLNWWLNVKNPMYKQLLELCTAGTLTCKVMQVGTQAETQYLLVK